MKRSTSYEGNYAAGRRVREKNQVLGGGKGMARPRSGEPARSMNVPKRARTPKDRPAQRTEPSARLVCWRDDVVALEHG
jgi:hypothetical protein